MKIPIITTEIVYLRTAPDCATIESGIRRERGRKERDHRALRDAIMDSRGGGEINPEQGGAAGGVYGCIYGNSERRYF